jgi:GNAT superfamily N-acetyltransferase
MRSDLMNATIAGPLTTPDELVQVKPLWLALHRHHLEVASYESLVTDIEASWERRRALYTRLFDEGGALFVARSDDGEAIGYAFAHINSGADDTFDAPNGIVEVVSLVVRADSRSRGLGTQLLDTVQEFAQEQSINTLKIAIMVGNDRARDFYRRSGYVAAEEIMYRTM